MTNSKLFQILRTFTQAEFKDFLRLAESSYFNNEGKYLVRFLSYIKKYHPLLEEGNKSLQKENIFKKLYPGKNYDDSIMRKISSSCSKLAEEFLVQNHLRKRELEKELFLMRELTQRSLTGLYEKKASRLKKELEGKQTVNEEYFRDMYLLEENLYNYYLTHPKDRLASEHHVKYGENLVMDSLLKIFNLLQDLSITRDNHNQFNEKQLTEALIENTNIERVLEYINNSAIANKFIVEIFNNLRLATIHINEDKYYYALKDSVFSNIGRLEKGFRVKTISFFLNNICTSKIKYGKREFYKEIFENYKFMLKHGLHLNPGNNYFHLVIYRAILITAASVNEFDWLEDFILKYEKDIQPEQRENLINYARGYLSFYRKDYESTLKYFGRLSFEIFFFRLDVKNFTLMTYYELGYTEEALSLIDTYKHFLNENKLISENIREIAQAFVGFVNSLIKIKEKGSQADAGLLRKKIENTDIVGFKFWLLEKAEELERNLK